MVRPATAPLELPGLDLTTSDIPTDTTRFDLTAERFVPDDWSGDVGGRLYRTGEMVRLIPDGELDFQNSQDRFAEPEDRRKQTVAHVLRLSEKNQ